MRLVIRKLSITEQAGHQPFIFRAACRAFPEFRKHVVKRYIRGELATIVQLQTGPQQVGMGIVDPGHDHAPAEVDDFRFGADVLFDALIIANENQPLSLNGQGLCPGPGFIHGINPAAAVHAVGRIRTGLDDRE